MQAGAQRCALGNQRLFFVCSIHKGPRPEAAHHVAADAAEMSSNGCPKHGIRPAPYDNETRHDQGLQCTQLLSQVARNGRSLPQGGDGTNR